MKMILLQVQRCFHSSRRTRVALSNQRTMDVCLPRVACSGGKRALVDLAFFCAFVFSLCVPHHAGAILSRIVSIGREESLGAHEFRGSIATDSANLPHVVTTDGTSAHFYDKIGGAWRAEYMNSALFNSSQYGNPHMEIAADQAWVSGVLWGGSFGFGIIYRQNMTNDPTPISTALKITVRPSPGKWDAGNLSVDPAIPNRAIASSMAGYYLPITFTGSGLSVGSRGQMYAGEGGEKNSFWISKAGNVPHADGNRAVWHGAIGGYYGYWSAYRNSLMSRPVTWASEPAYPAQNNDGAYVNVVSDNVEPRVAYITAAYAGIVMNIWDGNRMLFPINALLTIDPAGGVTARRYAPRLAPAKNGGVFVMWVRGGRLMIRFVAADGSMGDEVDVGPGAPGDICTDNEGNLHIFYVNNGAKYRKLEVMSYSRWITRSCNFNGAGGDELGVYDKATGNWYVRTVFTGMPLVFEENWGSGEMIPAPGDYDGDGRADMGAYDPVDGKWYVRTVGSNVLAHGLSWGGGGAVAVPGDYDGDGSDDLMTYSSRNGTWYVYSLSRRQLIGADTWGGFAGARPVPGDFNGDGEFDLAVFDQNTGNWFIKTLSRYLAFGFNWGWAGVPTVIGDYDGDRRSDMAVYDTASGKWYIYSRSRDQILRFGFQWGFSTTRPIAGDFDGDGKTDVAVYDTARGDWHIVSSSNGTPRSFNWGWNQTMPAPADFDGDGRTDPAVYHPAAGMWYVLKSTDNSMLTQQWGWAQAVPVPADYDGDGRADFTVYHPAGATWYVLRSTTTTMVQVALGSLNNQPMAADMDGDGIADLATYDPNTGLWNAWSIKSGSRSLSNMQWGFKGTRAHAGDFNGDGKADLGIFDTARGNWYVLRRGEVLAWRLNWGWRGAVPLAGDYNGDGKYDLAAFDPTRGDWYIRTLDGQVVLWKFNWGFAGVVPVSGRFDADARFDPAVFDPATGNWWIVSMQSMSPIAYPIRWGFRTTIPFGSSSW